MDYLENKVNRKKYIQLMYLFYHNNDLLLSSDYYFRSIEKISDHLFDSIYISRDAVAAVVVVVVLFLLLQMLIHHQRRRI